METDDGVETEEEERQRLERLIAVGKIGVEQKKRLWELRDKEKAELKAARATKSTPALPPLPV